MQTYGGFYLSRAHQLSGRVFERILKQSGVETFNGPQGRILYVLWEQERLSITELAKHTSLAKTTLTSMLDRMEETGLVERIPDTKDRRQIFIAISGKAKRYKKIYNQISEKMNSIFYKGFDEKEILLLEKMLSRIIENLEYNETN